jgi:hypothetical protein
MKILDFTIKKKEGENFAINSGDKNKIHLDFIEGYNSHFGRNIVHGCYLIIKFLKIINCNNVLSLEFEFINAFFYDDLITVNQKKSNSDEYFFFQNDQLKGIARFNFKDENFDKKKFNNIIYKKNFIVNTYSNELKLSLMLLSRYVGTYYPGKNSLITKISIKQKNCYHLKKKKIYISSNKPDVRFPLIDNYLKSKKYNIFFQTSFRPKLKLQYKNFNNKKIKYIKELKKNVLIIGASNGIGHDLLNLIAKNDKIKIIATYNNNIIKLKKKNIIKLKIDVNRNIIKLKKIIKDYSPMIIYYFATPKIDTLDSKRKKKLYEKFYITIPLRILNFSKASENNFFYPSTTFIGKKVSDYVNTKIKAEKVLSNLGPNIKTVRLPEINTRQNLSLITRKLPNFSDLLISDPKLIKKVFFLK